MFIVLLKFSNNKSQASQFMDVHKAWLQRGFDDGVIILSGSLQPAAGGAILARGLSRQLLQDRVDEDPFVKADVVSAEIIDLAVSRTEERLAFLLD